MTSLKTFARRVVKSLAPAVAALAAGLSAAPVTHAETVLTVTQYSYDNAGQPTCTAMRMNSATYSALPSDACTLATTGGYGADRITKTQYDNAGQLTDIIRAYGITTTNGFPATLQQTYAHYTYRNNGLKQTETDANGNKSTYVYDGYDRLYQLQYPSTSLGAGVSNTGDYEQFGYDNAGNRTSWRRRDGSTFGFSYDALNRETVKDVPGGTAADVYTGYDGQGHVSYHHFVSASGAGTSYSYDGLGRLSYTTDINGRTVYYAYNAASARITLTFPDANAIGYGVDVANRLTSIGWNAQTGLLTQGYDNLGRMTGQGKASGSTSYGYDAVGRLNSMTNDLNGTAYDVGWTFGFNPAGQMISSTATSTVYDYKELTSTSDGPSYDGLNRDSRLVPVTSACAAGGYDARQNLICDGLTNRSFTYDVENRLTAASGSGSGGTIALAYDPEGRLSSYTAAGVTTTFLYDGVNLIAEYNGASTTPLRRYVHGSGTDNPLVWLEGSGTTAERWFYTDYHGSVIGYSDATGTLSQLYKYGPYGEPTDINNTAAWWTGASRFRYTGQLMLNEARLYYYKARVYDPKWGRFLQTDPIGSGDDLDLYAYGKGDPVNGSDPTGMVFGDNFCGDTGCEGEDNFAAPMEGGGTPELAPQAAPAAGGAAAEGAAAEQEQAAGEGAVAEGQEPPSQPNIPIIEDTPSGVKVLGWTIPRSIKPTPMVIQGTYWPPNNGFDGEPSQAVLSKGQYIDRYGDENGRFFAPKGTTFEQRSLPPGYQSLEYSVYRIVRPLPVLSGPAAPWFNQPGGGIQFKTYQSAENLVKQGYLVKVN